MTAPITPVSVENRLLELDKRLDVDTDTLCEAEQRFQQAKAAFEIAYAKSLLRSEGVVPVREALAKTATESQRTELAVAEALLRSAREKLATTRTHIDVARSLGASTRTAYGMAS